MTLHKLPYDPKKVRWTGSGFEVVMPKALKKKIKRMHAEVLKDLRGER